MPSIRIAASRSEGTCPNDFAHDRRIRTGDRVITTTFFPGDEHVRDFGVRPFERYKVCLFCTAQRLRERERWGGLISVHGLTTADIASASGHHRA